MFRLALRSLRFGWRGFAATFIAMFFAGMFMTAAGSMLETGVRHVTPAHRLAAAPIVVTGNTTYTQNSNPVATLDERVRVDAGLAKILAGVPGVDHTVVDQSFIATVLNGAKPVGDPATYGHGWESAQLTPYRLNEGRPPSWAGEVVLDNATAQRAGVSVGGTVAIVVRGATETFRVTGIAVPAGRALEDALFFSDSDVRRLVSDPSKADDIGVFAAPGTDPAQLAKRVTSALASGELTVLTGDERGIVEFAHIDLTDIIVIAGVLAMLAVMVGLLGVASTLSLSLQQRHKEMALLRAIGATPRQVCWMIISETVSVSFIATLVSGVPGLLGGRWLFDELTRTGIAPQELVFYQSWQPTAAAALLAVLASGFAAYLASRRVTRTKPTEALSEGEGPRQRVGKIRLTLAVLSFVLSGSMVVAAMTLVTGPFIASPATFASIFFAVGVALLGPVLAKAMTAVLSPLLRMFGGLSGYLAGLNTRVRAARMAAVITPIMLLTGIATANLYLISTESSVQSVYTETLVSDVVLKAAPGGFAPDTLEKVRRLPAVAAASEVVASTGFVEQPKDPWGNKDLEGWQLLSYTPQDAAQVGAATAVQGTLSDLSGNDGKSVAIAQRYAQALGEGVGGSITIRMGDGARETFRIVALVDAKKSFEAIIMPARTLAAHTTYGLPDHIVVSPRPGATDADLATQLQQLSAQLPGTAVTDRKGLTDAFAHHLGAQALTSYVMTGTLLGYITIAVMNALWLAIRGRAREFGLLRLTGATRAQVMRMMTFEAVMTAVIGVILGTLVAPATLIPFSLARADRLTPAGSPWMYLGIVGFVGLLTLGATLAPTWQALKVRPIEAAVGA